MGSVDNLEKKNVWMSKEQKRLCLKIQLSGHLFSTNLILQVPVKPPLKARFTRQGTDMDRRDVICEGFALLGAVTGLASKDHRVFSMWILQVKIGRSWDLQVLDTLSLQLFNIQFLDE